MEIVLECGLLTVLMFQSWHEAHNSVGVSGPGVKWGLAEGEVGGFEGRLDEKRQRNHVEGWRFSGLPWEQS